MGKKWIRAIAWLAGIFFILLVLFAGALYFNRDRITRTVLTEANSLLKAPVEVEDVEVSLRKFPYASLKFTNVFCSGVNATASDTLLHAQEMYFEFDLWKVLLDDISIDRISFANGSINIFIPEEGAPNYEIWQSDTSSQSSGIFTLEKVYLDNFKLKIHHVGSEFRSMAHVGDLAFSGSFDSENFEIESETEFFLDSLSVESTSYLAAVPVSGGFLLKGNADTIFIENGNANVKEIPIAFSTRISPEGVEVKAQNESADLAELLKLTRQQKWADIPEELQLKGRGRISFIGNFPEKDPIDLLTNFQASGVSFNGFGNGNIQNIKLTGSYSLRNDVDELRISDFSGNGKTGAVAGAVSIKNFDRPAVVLDLKSNLELNEWLSFVPLDTVQNPSGRAVVDLHLENTFRSLSDIQPAELRRAQAQGKFSLEKIAFRFKDSDKEVEGLNGNLEFDGNDLRVNNFFFRTGQSDIYLEGSFGNVLNYIFFEDEKLTVNTQLRSQELRLEDFILSSSEDAEDEDYDLSFAQSIDLDLRLQVDKFYFEKFYASDISGELGLHQGIIRGHSLKMNADGGSFAGNFTINTNGQAAYGLDADLVAENVDMHDLFVSFSNFGQEEILAENIFGTAKANLQMTATMAKNLQVDPASVNLQAELAIAGGKLTAYEPMLALSQFADIDELKDVRFDQLQNTISIENSEIVIPQMNISSNVMNLSVSGRHRFDNTIDYSMTMKLSDVLFSKRKSNGGNSEFDQHIVEVDHRDDPNIYIKMSGSASDPQISLDKKNMGRSIEQDLQEQKRELRNIFTRKKEEDKKGSSGIKYELFGEDEPDEK